MTCFDASLLKSFENIILPIMQTIAKIFKDEIVPNRWAVIPIEEFPIGENPKKTNV